MYEHLGVRALDCRPWHSARPCSNARHNIEMHHTPRDRQGSVSPDRGADPTDATSGAAVCTACASFKRHDTDGRRTTTPVTCTPGRRLSAIVAVGALLRPPTDRVDSTTHSFSAHTSRAPPVLAAHQPSRCIPARAVQLSALGTLQLGKSNTPGDHGAGATAAALHFGAGRSRRGQRAITVSSANS